MIELSAVEAVREVPARYCHCVRIRNSGLLFATPSLKLEGRLARRAKGAAVDGDLALDLGSAHSARLPNRAFHIRVGLAFRAQAQVATWQGGKRWHACLAEEALPQQRRC
eukprot:scaffold94705_cov69-Phaeocystis_antarctica.AAC.2